jgi:hypothetical protein
MEKQTVQSAINTLEKLKRCYQANENLKGCSFDCEKCELYVSGEEYGTVKEVLIDAVKEYLLRSKQSRKE